MITSQEAPRGGLASSPAHTERLEEAARRYDPAALGRIFDESFPAVHGVLVALLGDREAAESAARRTYERVLEQLRSRRAVPTDLGRWLLRAAAVEAMRQGGPPSGEPAPAAMRIDDPRRLRALLWRRPRDQREVLALRLLVGMDSAQVAAAGGRSVGLVRALQERGLRGLTGVAHGGDRGFDQALDRGLDRVAQGADPHSVAGGLEAHAGLLPLLQAAQTLRALLPPGVDGGARDRVRAGLLAAAAQRQASWVHSHQGNSARPFDRRRPLRPLRAAGRLAGLVALVVLGVVVGVVVAGMSVTSEPDSAIYPLRRVAENVLVLAHRNPASRASLEVDLADQRLREAEAMALQGRADLSVQAVHDHFVELRQAARALIDGDSPQDAAWRAARRKLGDAETNSVQQVETQLKQDGDSWAARQVQAEVTSFEADRRYLDQELGPVPGAQSGGGGSGGSQPSGQPTAVP